MIRYGFLFCVYFRAIVCLSQPSTAEKLDQLLTAYTNADLFSGTVLISREGENILTKGYGQQDIKRRVHNDANTSFQLYSITKSFTSTLIFQLIEQGALTLETPLNKFYPALPQGDSITIGHLLTHTSGLYAYNNDQSMPVSSEAAMLDFLAKQPLDFKPGSNWRYCNTGYYLLGFIIQKVTGLSYEYAMHKYILDPLEMKDTGFDFKNFTSYNKATGYEISNGKADAEAIIYDKEELFAAGGMYSTVGDLYKFHRAMQAGRLIRKESMIKAYSTVRNNYAYGWYADEFMGKKVVSHSGGAAGSRSYLVRIPDEDLCIVILSNSEATNVTALRKTILAVLFDQPYKIPVHHVLGEKALKSYEGTYSFSPSFNLYITSGNGRLIVQPSKQSPSRPLCESNDSFYVDEIDGYLVFKKDKAGIYDTLLLEQEGQQYRGKRIDAKWGICGSATPNGWNGPDISMTKRKGKDNCWFIQGFYLNDGEVKFRFNKTGQSVMESRRTKLN